MDKTPQKVSQEYLDMRLEKIIQHYKRYIARNEKNWPGEKRIIMLNNYRYEEPALSGSQ